MDFLSKEQGFYDFGSFRIDRVNQLLLQDGQPVSLQPKTFDLLLLLVERSGEVISKEEFMARLWPETAVEEANLTQNVYLLRKLLGQTPDGRKYIETIPKRGYRFLSGVVKIVERETVTEQLPPSLSPPEFRTSPQPARPASWTLLLSLLTASIFATAFMWHQFNKPGKVFTNGRDRPLTSPTAPFASVKISKLTDLGSVLRPTISADGKYLAYSLADGAESYTLWLKNLPSESATQIGPPSPAGYGSLTFAPNEYYLYYESKQYWPSDIYRIPFFGGPARKIVAGVWSGFALSPDERQLAFVRRNPELSESVLTVAKIEDGSERQLAALREPSFFGLKTSGPAWSPDGQKVISIASSVEAISLMEFNLADGAQRTIPLPQLKEINGLVWMPDGNGWMISALEKTAEVRQIYMLSAADNTLRRVTNDLSNYYRLSLTADARRLVAEQYNEVTNLWVVPVEGDSAAARQITFRNSRGEGYRGAAWSPDGKIVFASEQNGRADLWVSDADGQNRHQLTTNAGTINQQPSVSPDGRRIAFVSDRAGRPNVWLIDADGLNPQQLTFGEDESSPTFTPDGRSVLYASTDSSGRSSIWKKSIEPDDQPTFLIANGAKPTISPDGKLITYSFADESAGNEIKTAVFSLVENKVLKVLPVHRRELYRWSPDSKSLAYLSEKDSNIWTVSVDDKGAARQLTRFPFSYTVRWFDRSRDGKRLVIVRSVVSSDAVLLTDTR